MEEGREEGGGGWRKEGEGGEGRGRVEEGKGIADTVDMPVSC